MGTDSVLWLVGLLCVAVFGGTIRQAFQATEAERYRSMWAWYSWTFLSSSVLCLGWAMNGDPHVWLRNIILGLAGAALGGSVSIWAGYFVHDMSAHAQSASKGTNIPNKGEQSPSTKPLSPAIGDNNTIVNLPAPTSMGSGNTFVAPTDSNGNTNFNRGGIAIGAGAQADPTSVAIGAGARAGNPVPEAKK